MRSFFSYCLIGNKPYISSVPSVLFSGFPSTNIGFVLIRYPYCKLVKLYISVLCKMKDIFVEIIHAASTGDRFEVPYGYALRRRKKSIFSKIITFYSYGFYPMDGILQFII